MDVTGAEGGRLKSAIFCNNSSSVERAAVVGDVVLGLAGASGTATVGIVAVTGAVVAAGVAPRVPPGGAEEEVTGGVTAMTGEVGFVELGRGVQASSSNPLGLETAEEGVDPASIKFGDGVRAEVVVVAVVGETTS
jgi:hypothetical protein